MTQKEMQDLDVNNNINNNTLWSDVKTALEANTKITVTPKA